MPLHTAPLSRRSFLSHSTAAAGLLVWQSAWSAERNANPNVFALLSDTHIPESPEVVSRDVNMTSNLKQVVREVLANDVRPAGVIINGDCAYLKGLPADYANLANCLAPLSDAGYPLHMTMGNHDDRGPFYAALQNQKPAQSLLESRHIAILESPHANWFLLDSLREVNITVGEIGEQQRAWLAKALAARSDKPAIVMAHHTPQYDPPPEGKPWGGIRDTKEFMELLSSFKHVKAFIFGHSHDWAKYERSGMHLINLPPVAYVFGAGKPNGWVLAEVKENGVSLRLKTIDASHAKNGETWDLTWI